MAVNIKKKLGEVQPICDSCGVALCWSISYEEYKEHPKFWDTWECRDCNPNYKGSYQKYKEERKLTNV